MRDNTWVQEWAHKDTCTELSRYPGYIISTWWWHHRQTYIHCASIGNAYPYKSSILLGNPYLTLRHKLFNFPNTKFICRLRNMFWCSRFLHVMVSCSLAFLVSWDFFFSWKYNKIYFTGSVVLVKSASYKHSDGFDMFSCSCHSWSCSLWKVFNFMRLYCYKVLYPYFSCSCRLFFCQPRPPKPIVFTYSISYP